MAFVRRNHRWPVNSPHKGPVTRTFFPLEYVIMHVTDSNNSGNDIGLLFSKFDFVVAYIIDERWVALWQMAFVATNTYSADCMILYNALYVMSAEWTMERIPFNKYKLVILVCDDEKWTIFMFLYSGDICIFIQVISDEYCIFLAFRPALPVTNLWVGDLWSFP